MRYSIYIIIILICFSCKNKPFDTNTLFTEVGVDLSGIYFKNTVVNSKQFNIFKYRNFYNGGGVAIGDINNDSLPDIYFTANQGENKLFLNKGNFVFEDITKTAGVQGQNIWSTGVVMVDINNDELLDIYVCNTGGVFGEKNKNELFINNGDNTFTEKAKEYNLAESGLTTHTAFFDYDKDGDLDAYILNNSFIPISSLNYDNRRDIRDVNWNVASVLKGGGDKLLRNDNGKFKDVSEQAGIYGSLIGFGLGVTVGDINKDSYPDIYVSNDFYEHDYLYINNKDGTFTESIKKWTTHISHSSMGADMADINNDGALDVFVTDMLPESNKRIKETTQFVNYDLQQRKLDLDFGHQYMQNTLQLNNGNLFTEIANFSNLARTDWSWGALIFDMDNDGNKDIFVCNGIFHDLTNQDFVNFFANEVLQKMIITGKKEEISAIINKMPSKPLVNYAFKNLGNLKFKETSNTWGFDLPTFSNGAAYGDLDNDGDLDLVINNVNQNALIYKNNTDKLTKNNYLKIMLKGGATNTFGIGSKIKLYSKDEVILQEIMPTRGFQSSVDYTQTIGIGKKKIDSIQVLWQDNTFETIRNITPNKSYVFNKKNASKLYSIPQSRKKPTIFSELKTIFEAHKENKYVDFDYEGLIYQMLSKEGPTISVGDINRDGLDDIFVGGAKGQEGKIYLQTKKISFKKTSSQIFNIDKNYEDTASAFFDADNDGDLDLMVGSGGNEANNTSAYQTRLYINNGRGRFKKSSLNIQATLHNTSVIAPCDFDLDGDIDVFVGSRSVPAIYGINAKQQLLENNGKGKFRDVTKNKAYMFKNLGMITDACWFDFDGDQKKDLFVVEDWGTIKIFKNNGKQLVENKTNLTKLKGWWNAIKISDLNKDGFPDLILGNKGLNIPYKPSKKAPLKIYINDFDNNGTIEQILTKSNNNIDSLILTKNELTSQIVSLKKKNLKYSDYATKSIRDLFSEKIITQSIVREVNTSESVVALNNKKGNFKIVPLPKEAQFSSVNAIEVLDVNNDSNLDILIGGNQYDLKPQYSRNDSSYGGLLIGNGKGNFDWVDYSKSGFFVKGEIKNIKTFTNKSKTYVIVGINNEQAKLFKLK